MVGCMGTSLIKLKSFLHSNLIISNLPDFHNNTSLKAPSLDSSLLQRARSWLKELTRNSLYHILLDSIF